MNPPLDDRHRRTVLRALLAASAWQPWSALSLAAGTTSTANRLVIVILRGGMDGLSAVPALGDPAFAAARGPLGQFPTPALALDANFSLHPQLTELHAMFGRGELAVLHAVGLPYRERSHFDAQQVLESGGLRPYELSTGWLGRALGQGSAKGIALSTTVPLVLRGPGAVDTWAPSALPEPTVDLVARLERLYEADGALAAALARAKALHFGSEMPATEAGAGMNGRKGNFVTLAQRAVEFLEQPNGPQAAVLELGGWDSHANQANAAGPLSANLGHLDAGLGALRDGLSRSGTWKRTVIVVVTEFGREVSVNGTQGTDHGTGGAAFVLGGAVQGGRVVADWPGLAKKDRFEGRDLRITTDLRSVFKGLLADHLQVSTRSLNGEVFPGGEALKGLALLRS